MPGSCRSSAQKGGKGQRELTKSLTGKVDLLYIPAQMDGRLSRFQPWQRDLPYRAGLDFEDEAANRVLVRDEWAGHYPGCRFPDRLFQAAERSRFPVRLQSRLGPEPLPNSSLLIASMPHRV
jgi:hypothetical protein